MILIKDRHRLEQTSLNLLLILGKYDTYKGSTQNLPYLFLSRRFQGNMILIKDRHMTIVLVIWTSRAEGNMILIKDYVLGVICF